MQVNKLLKIFFKILGFYVLVGIILRAILVFLPITERVFSVSEGFKIFLLGAVNDFCVGTILFIFIWLHLVFLSNTKFKTPWRYIILGGELVLLIYLVSLHTIFDNYGDIVSTFIITFLVFKVISFIILLFLQGARTSWRYTMYCVIFFLYVFFIIFDAVSEFLFWNEFGVRYNFIAVDYLVNSQV